VAETLSQAPPHPQPPVVDAEPAEPAQST